MKRSLVIIFDDIAKQTASVTIENIGAATKTQCETLIANLVLRTNAGVKSYSIVESYDREQEGDNIIFPYPVNTSEYDTVDQKLIFTFKRGRESKTLQIPAPKEDMFEVVPNAGKRLLSTMGDFLALRFSSFYDIDTSYVNGWLKSKK